MGEGIEGGEVSRGGRPRREPSNEGVDDLQTLDLASRLSRHKREGQSFSQVIKEHFSGAKKGRDLMAVLREVSLSEKALDAIEAQVERGKAHIAKAPEL